MNYEAQLRPNGVLRSIFFGGGTPSLMPPETVAALINEAVKLWPVADDIEITLEANPSSVEASKFSALANAGINRVSLGLQSLDDEALAFLGRAHSVNEGLAALNTAQRHFSRVNFDLIYALPGQSEAAWRVELARALSFGTTHMSLYQLTIEPGTRFATMVQAKTFEPAEPDHGATLFDVTADLTAKAGLPAYETSNHASPGQESQHNLIYWRYGTYLGIGPGAHGRRDGVATERHKKPENWIKAVARNQHGIVREDVLTPEESVREAMVMGLRLAEGVDVGSLSTRFAIAPAAILDETKVALLSKLGLIEVLPDHARVMPQGRLLLDRILAEIVAI